MMVKPLGAYRIFAQGAATPAINLSEAGLLLVVGTSLLLFADASRYPGSLWFFGLWLTGLGIGILIVPRKWHRRYAVWSAKLIKPYIRFLAPLSLILGALLMYSVI